MAHLELQLGAHELFSFPIHVMIFTETDVTQYLWCSSSMAGST